MDDYHDYAVAVISGLVPSQQENVTRMLVSNTSQGSLSNKCRAAWYCDV
jgi:hypothetical protein